MEFDDLPLIAGHLAGTEVISRSAASSMVNGSLMTSSFLSGILSPDGDTDIVGADDAEALLLLNITERTSASSQQPVPPWIAEMHENGKRNAVIYVAVVLSIYLTGILLLLARYWRQGHSAWGQHGNHHLRRERQHNYPAVSTGHKEGRRMKNQQVCTNFFLSKMLISTWMPFSYLSKHNIKLDITFRIGGQISIWESLEKYFIHLISL